MKLGPRHNYHKGRAAIRHYANQPANLRIAFVSSYKLPRFRNTVLLTLNLLCTGAGPSECEWWVAAPDDVAQAAERPCGGGGDGRGAARRPGEGGGGEARRGRRRQPRDRPDHLHRLTLLVHSSAANWLIGEVVQSRRRGPSPWLWKPVVEPMDRFTALVHSLVIVNTGSALCLPRRKIYLSIVCKAALRSCLILFPLRQ